MKLLKFIFLISMSTSCLGDIGSVPIVFEKPSIFGNKDIAEKFKIFWSEKELHLDQTETVDGKQYIGKSESGKSLSSRFKGFDAKILDVFVENWQKKSLDELVKLFGDPELMEAGMSEGDVLWQWSLWNQEHGDALVCLRVTICWRFKSKEIVFGVLSLGRSKSN